MNLDLITKFIPLLTGILYAIVGVAYLLKKDYAWATVWCAYALANFGLISASH
jgi:hypothetical protein